MGSPHPRNSRRAAVLFGALSLAFLAACGGGGEGGRRGGGPGGHGKGGEASAPSPERRVLVDAATVETGSVADHLITSGTLEGEFQADLYPEATGVVSKLYVDEGEQVRAGQLLALISNPSLDAGAERASVEVSRSQRGYEEAQRLHASGAISDKELQDAKDNLSLSKATYGEATRSRGFTRIDSPIAGTVSIREIREGELASSGRRAFQVVDLAKLRVVVQLPERDLSRIATGQTAILTGAYDEEIKVNGTVSRISPVVDPTTGTVKVTVDVEPDQTAIRPGQYVKVRIEVDRHNDVLTIPRRALVWDDGEPVAWKVVEAKPPEPKEEEEGEPEAAKGGFLAKVFGGGEENEADGEPEKDPWEGIPRRGVEKARLEIGYIDTDRVEVVKGLEGGEQVVEVGRGGLRPETLVKLSGDPDPKKEEKEEDKASTDASKKAEGAEG
jgi:membrane fusion protein (multidrug efflux system)